MTKFDFIFARFKINGIEWNIPAVAATKCVVSLVNCCRTVAPNPFAIKYARLCSSFKWLGTKPENTSVFPIKTSLRIFGIKILRSGICLGKKRKEISGVHLSLLSMVRYLLMFRVIGIESRVNRF